MSGFKAFLLAGAVVAAAAFTAPAYAITFSQSIQFGPGPTDYSMAPGNADTGSGSFFLFDTNLGKLNSITFSSTYGFTSTISISEPADSQGPANGNARTQSAAQFTSNLASVNQALDRAVNNISDPVDGNKVSFGGKALTPIAYDVRGNVTNYTLTPGGAGTSFASSGTGSTGPTVDTNQADLDAFSVAGGGTFAPLFTTLSGLVISNSGGNVNATQTTSATGTLTLVYNYDAPSTSTPVPEPASLALLGAGLLGLGLTRRKSV